MPALHPPAPTACTLSPAATAAGVANALHMWALLHFPPGSGGAPPLTYCTRSGRLTGGSAALSTGADRKVLSAWAP